MEETISVIVPVYQVECYLDRCIRSILEQTYKNLEIILVDDGSTDGSGDICEKYEKADDRIRVIRKKNGGVSSARNAGLDRMSGELVTFVDSDDYIAPDMCEVLYSEMKKYHSEISVCFWREVFDQEGEEKEKRDADPYETECLDTVQALKKLLYQRKTDSCPWGKLYRREVFENIRFPEKKIYGEDLAIMCQAFDRAERIVFIDYRGYYYLQRRESIVGSSFSEGKMSLIDFVEENERFIQNKYPSLIKAAVSRSTRANFHIYLQIPSSEEYREYRERIEENIRRRRKTVLMDKEAARGTKAAALLSYLGFGVLRFLEGCKKWGKTF